MFVNDLDWEAITLLKYFLCFVCLFDLTSLSIAMFMSGRCLHLMGLLPKIRMHGTQKVRQI